MQKVDGYQIMRNSPAWRSLDRGHRAGMQEALPRSSQWVTPGEVGKWGFCPQAHRLAEPEHNPLTPQARKGLEIHTRVEHESRRSDNLKPLRLAIGAFILLCLGVLVWIYR